MPDDLRTAVDLLVRGLKKKGGVVCFPTETVYALAMGLVDNDSFDRLYELKRRSRDKVFSVLVSKLSLFAQYAYVDDAQYDYINAHYKLPITFVLRCKCDRMQEIFGTTIGIRIPNHPIAYEVLNAYGGVIVATSANISGAQDASEYGMINKEILSELDAIIADDKGVIGKASTVLDLTDYPRISVIREGAIDLKNM